MLCTLFSPSQTMATDFKSSMIKHFSSWPWKIIREYKEYFCICQAKVVFDALGPVWEMAMPNTCEPMVRLHVDALPRDHRLEEDICSACSDWIDASTSNPPGKQPITEMYYYCLGCQHPFSRIQPPHPGPHRHGHLKLAPKKFGRHKEEQNKAAWQVFWMAPRLKKAIKSIEHVEAWTKQPNRVTVSERGYFWSSGLRSASKILCLGCSFFWRTVPPNE